MSCDDGLRPFFGQYSAISVLGDVVMLPLQIARLTAIADRAALCSPSQHPMWKVALHRWWAPVGWMAAQGAPSAICAVIATLAPAEVTGSLLLTSVMVTPELLRWPHLHVSIHPCSPKPVREGWMVVSSWLPFLCLLCSVVSEHVTCALPHNMW